MDEWQALGGTPRSTNGEDGHYIVVPDGYLTNQCKPSHIFRDTPHWWFFAC